LQCAEHSGNISVVGALLGSWLRSHRLPSSSGGACCPLPKNSIPVLSLRHWEKPTVLPQKKQLETIAPAEQV